MFKKRSYVGHSESKAKVYIENRKKKKNILEGTGFEKKTKEKLSNTLISVSCLLQVSYIAP